MDCQYCGEEIIGKRSDAKYCSPKCLDTAYKNRKRSSKVRRGPNDGRSSTKEYKSVQNKKSRRKRREKEGYKGAYAKARELGFRSMFEVKVFTDAIDKGMALEYESVKLNYKIEATYTPDLILPNGICIEVKGYLRPTDMKIKWVKKSHPDLDIRFVFMDANKLVRKNGKLRYWQWAEKIGCKWSEKSIPLDWFDE